MKNFTLTLLTTLFFLPLVTFAATDGMGTATITPNSVQAGATQTLTIRYGGVSGTRFATGSLVRITVPAGWTAPQRTNSAAAGYVNAVNIGAGNCNPGAPTVSGRDVTIPMRCGAGSEMDITFLTMSAPNSAGTTTFTTQSQDGNAGAANIATSPSVTTTAIPVTATVSPTTRVYDGTASALATCALTGVLPADVGQVSCSATATYASKNVGTSTPTASPTLSGALAGKYTLTGTTVNPGTITQRTLTVTATGPTRAYDAMTAAAVTFSDNHVAGDVVTIGGIAAFTNKNVGTGKAVNVIGLSITGGADAANYTLNGVSTLATTGTIATRPLTVTPTAANKIYDATTAATITYTNNALAGDTVAAAGTATFADKNVGAAKTVNLTVPTLTGADAANYVVSGAPTTTTANITAAPLTATFTANNKVYDGTTTATIATRTPMGMLAGDTVTLSGGTATFANKDVGTAKVVSASGFTLGGADGGNYTLGAIVDTTAHITAKSITVTADAKSKSQGNVDPGPDPIIFPQSL